MGRRARARRASKLATRILVILGTSGVVHLLRPRTFDRIVPKPLPARATTLVSGAAELAVAVGLAVPRTRRLAGMVAAALFVAVFPANLKMAGDLLDRPSSPRYMRIISVLRLPLQLPLVAWALTVGRNG